LSKNTTESVFPPFPTVIIQGVAKDFVNLYSPIRETPEAFLWLSFVTYFGNAMSPYVRLDCASSEPRFYSVVIGKSGRTRKSAGNNVARDLFRQVGAKDQKVVEGFGSAEGMLVMLGEATSPKPAIFHLDEMNILASKTDITGSVGIAGLHKLFEDHDYDHPLAHGNYTVRNAYLSLIGASTLEDFTKTWSAKHKDTGFFSRLLVVAADTDKRIHRPVDPDAAKLASLVREVKGLVLSVIASPKVFKMDQDADEAWKKFYDAFGDGPEWNRIDTYGFRLMVVQAVLRHEGTVTRDNVQQVIDFLQYEVAVREAVSPVIAENSAAQMEELIRRHLAEGQTMRKRDLARKTNYQRLGIEIFERAITNMTKNGEIICKMEGKSALLTRATFTEDELPGTSKVVIADVVARSEDSPASQNPRKNAPLDGDVEHRLHFLPESRPSKEMIM
jgi:hypothetical protein